MLKTKTYRSPENAVPLPLLSCVSARNTTKVQTRHPPRRTACLINMRDYSNITVSKGGREKARVRVIMRHYALPVVSG